MSVLGGLAKGMRTTMRILLEPKHTVRYPDERRQRSARFRGRHELRRYENGMEMCVGCELCQVACPANAITVYAAENDPQDPRSPGERYAYRYQVDMLRCIFCGLCEEACPTDALHLTQEFELAAFSRKALVFDREVLVNPQPGPFPIPEGVYPPFEGRVPLTPAARPQPDGGGEGRRPPEGGLPSRT